MGPKRGRAAQRPEPEEELITESDDGDIDNVFAKRGGSEDDEIDEEAVYDLSDSDDSGSSGSGDDGDEYEDGEDDDDDEIDLEEEMERGGKAGRRE